MRTAEAGLGAVSRVWEVGGQPRRVWALSAGSGRCEDSRGGIIKVYDIYMRFLTIGLTVRYCNIYVATMYIHY